MALTLTLTGCSKETVETTDTIILPEGLKDCKLYRVSDGFNTIKIMRCPNSSTSTKYRSGKTDRQAIVVDNN